jgi:hypothetical protein
VLNQSNTTFQKPQFTQQTTITSYTSNPTYTSNAPVTNNSNGISQNPSYLNRGVGGYNSYNNSSYTNYNQFEKKMEECKISANTDNGYFIKPGDFPTTLSVKIEEDITNAMIYRNPEIFDEEDKSIKVSESVAAMPCFSYLSTHELRYLKEMKANGKNLDVNSRFANIILNAKQELLDRYTAGDERVVKMFKGKELDTLKQQDPLKPFKTVTTNYTTFPFNNVNNMGINMTGVNSIVNGSNNSFKSMGNSTSVTTQNLGMNNQGFNNGLTNTLGNTGNNFMNSNLNQPMLNQNSSGLYNNGITHQQQFPFNNVSNPNSGMSTPSFPSMNMNTNLIQNQQPLNMQQPTSFGMSNSSNIPLNNNMLLGNQLGQTNMNYVSNQQSNVPLLNNNNTFNNPIGNTQQTGFNTGFQTKPLSQINPSTTSNFIGNNTTNTGFNPSTSISLTATNNLLGNNTSSNININPGTGVNAGIKNSLTSEVKSNWLNPIETGLPQYEKMRRELEEKIEYEKRAPNLRNLVNPLNDKDIIYKNRLLHPRTEEMQRIVQRLGEQAELQKPKDVIKQLEHSPLQKKVNKTQAQPSKVKTSGIQCLYNYNKNKPGKPSNRDNPLNGNIILTF